MLSAETKEQLSKLDIRIFSLLQGDSNNKAFTERLTKLNNYKLDHGGKEIPIQELIVTLQLLQSEMETGHKQFKVEIVSIVKDITNILDKNVKHLESNVEHKLIFDPEEHTSLKYIMFGTMKRQIASIGILLILLYFIMYTINPDAAAKVGSLLTSVFKFLI